MTIMIPIENRGFSVNPEAIEKVEVCKDYLYIYLSTTTKHRRQLKFSVHINKEQETIKVLQNNTLPSFKWPNS